MGDNLRARASPAAGPTSRAAELPTVVRLSPVDRPFVGSILCDDPYVIGDDEVESAAGAAAPPTMRAVDAALRLALGL